VISYIPVTASNQFSGYEVDPYAGVNIYDADTDSWSVIDYATVGVSKEIDTVAPYEIRFKFNTLYEHAGVAIGNSFRVRIRYYNNQGSVTGVVRDDILVYHDFSFTLTACGTDSTNAFDIDNFADSSPTALWNALQVPIFMVGQAASVITFSDMEDTLS
jgi:hypothetical protein